MKLYSRAIQVRFKLFFVVLSCTDVIVHNSWMKYIDSPTNMGRFVTGNTCLFRSFHCVHTILCVNVLSRTDRRHHDKRCVRYTKIWHDTLNTENMQLHTQMHFLLEILLEICVCKHRDFDKFYFIPLPPSKEIWCVYSGVQCIMNYISNRRELPFWQGVNESWSLYLWFCISEDWKDFPQASFWLCTFQTCFSSRCLHISGASPCMSHLYCHWASIF